MDVFKKYLLFWSIPVVFLTFWYFKQIIFPFLTGIILGLALQSFALYITNRFKTNYYINLILIYLCFISLLIFGIYLTFQILLSEVPDFISKISPTLTIIKNFLPENWQNILTRDIDYLPRAFSFVFNIFGGLFSIVSVVVISIYVGLDKKFPESLFNLFLVKDYQDDYLRIFKKIKTKISFWFLGQIFLMIFISLAVYVYTGLILKIKYSPLISLISGILEFVPIFGPLIALVISSFIVFVEAPQYLLPLIIYFILLQQVENHFIVPLVMKKAMSIDPLLVILAIFIGGKLGGVFGIITIIPILGAFIEIRRYLKMRDGVIGSTQDSGS